MEFSDRLKEARAASGLTTTKLGAAVGINPSMITNWEVGRYVPRDASTVRKMANVMHVDFEWLMYGKQYGYDNCPQVTNSDPPTAEVKMEPVKEEPEPAAPEPKPVKNDDPTFLIYKAEDGKRLDNINLCIRHIREMQITKAEKIAIHKTLTYFRDSIERTILFGE